MGATIKTLYETDFAAWAEETAAALRAGRVEELDLENVAEEIEGLARAERKAVRSQLQRLMMHLLKCRLQPERRGPSWDRSIINAREEIRDDIEDSPSLQKHLEESVERVYQRAVTEAFAEARVSDADRAKLPIHCPWTLDELLRGDLSSLR
jgi:hypothetical protein